MAVAVSLVILLLVGLTRARPGKDVPAYDPAATTTTTPATVTPPDITAGIRTPATPATAGQPSPSRRPAATTTTPQRP